MHHADMGAEGGHGSVQREGHDLFDVVRETETGICKLFRIALGFAQLALRPATDLSDLMSFAPAGPLLVPDPTAGRYLAALETTQQQVGADRTDHLATARHQPPGTARRPANTNFTVQHVYHSLLTNRDCTERIVP